MSIYLTVHVGLPLGNILTLVQQMNSSISDSTPQNRIALKCSYPGQEFIRILLSLVPRSRSAVRRMHYRTGSDGKLGGAWERVIPRMSNPKMSNPRMSNPKMSNAKMSNRVLTQLVQF